MKQESACFTRVLLYPDASYECLGICCCSYDERVKLLPKVLAFCQLRGIQELGQWIGVSPSKNIQFGLLSIMVYFLLHQNPSVDINHTSPESLNLSTKLLSLGLTPYQPTGVYRCNVVINNLKGQKLSDPRHMPSLITRV